MYFDPFEFFEDGGGFDDGFGDYRFYDEPARNVMAGFYWIIGLIIAAIVIGIVLNFTFLSRKNEGKFHGFWGKVYNCFAFNRFYAEGIVKMLNVIAAFLVTFLGIYMLFTGGVISGILVIVFGNIGVRLLYELIMMFVILCKKTVTMDKRLHPHVRACGS